MKEKLIFLILLALLSFTQSAGVALADDPGIPDTCRVGCLDVTLPGQQVMVEVSVYNDEALGGVVVPLVFGDPSLDVVCDSVSFVGTRVEGAEYLGVKIDTAGYKLLFYAIWIASDLSVGDGIVANLHFTTGPNWDSTLCLRIDSTFYPPTTRLEFTPRSTGQVLRPKLQKGCLGSGYVLAPELKSPSDQAIVCSPDTFPLVWSKPEEGASYTLQYAQDSDFTTGVVTIGGIVDTTYDVSLPWQTYYWHVSTTNQCGKESPYQDQPYSFYVFRSGDVTDDGVINLGDVVFLINYLYKEGLPPNILQSGDVVHDGMIELGDLVYMINYIYKGGPAPTCP
jgi:hypothetical protein